MVYTKLRSNSAYTPLFDKVVAQNLCFSVFVYRHNVCFLFNEIYTGCQPRLNGRENRVCCRKLRPQTVRIVFHNDGSENSAH